MYYELSNAFLNHWLTSEPVKIIHMVRENVLRILLSHWVAKKRNIWHTEHRLDPASIHVDPDTIIPMLDELSEMQQLMTKRFPAPKAMRVSHEEFCRSPEILGQKVSDFLEVDLEPMVMPRFERTTPMETSYAIQNYDEIASVLRGTRFERYLYQ
jgi:LPS sulfotransferase NodH